MRYESDHWYHYNDGVIRNGLMVATWALTDAKAGDGGFVCVPGSHKTNFINLLPTDAQSQEVMPEYVRQPAVKAGDVILFTEALMHGTRAWQGSDERRVVSRSGAVFERCRAMGDGSDPRRAWARGSVAALDGEARGASLCRAARAARFRNHRARHVTSARWSAGLCHRLAAARASSRRSATRRHFERQRTHSIASHRRAASARRKTRSA